MMTTPPLDALGRAAGILPVWARYSLPVVIDFPVANVPRDVPHTLDGAVPTGMLVVWADAEIHAAPGRAWTETTAYLQANAAMAHATVIFVLARETPTAEVFGALSSSFKGSPSPGGAPLGAHAPTHEVGGSDELTTAAWTNFFNVFTQDQAITKSWPAFYLRDLVQPVDSQSFALLNRDAVLKVEARADGGGVLATPLTLARNGNVTVGGNLIANGVLTVNGFGGHTFSASGAGSNTLTVNNTSSVSSAFGGYISTNDAGRSFFAYMLSSSYSSSGDVSPNGALLGCDGAGGISISARQGAIRFYTGGMTEWMSLSPTGVFSVNGFGTHTFSASGPAANRIAVNNPSSVNGALGGYISTNDAAATFFAYVTSSGYAPGGDFVASGGAVGCDGSGGLSLSARHSSGAIRFYTGGVTERMQIGANGHVGLNTPPDAPDVALFIALAQTSYGVYAECQSAATVSVYGMHRVNASSGYPAVFYNSGSSAGLALSNTGAWFAASDRRLKTDIRPISVLDKLRQIQPRDFLWKTHATSDRPGQRQYGFVAQEVETVFPDLIASMPDGTPGLTYTGFIAPLVQGWQDHDRRLAALEAAHKETHAE
jgi:Chaperone of endosialidase